MIGRIRRKRKGKIIIIEYTADVVLTNDEMMQGFDRMCEWADKKKKEGKNNVK